MADTHFYMLCTITLGFPVGWGNHVPNRHIAWFLHLGALMKTFFQQYLEDHADSEYCAYCLESRNDRGMCCHENHWIPLSDLEHVDQMSIIQYEYDTAFPKESK